MVKKIVSPIIILLLAVILMWRFIPRSAETVIPLNEGDVEDFELTVSVPEDGVIDIYTLCSDNIDEDLKNEIINIIYEAKYRPGFINIISGGRKSVEGKNENIITAVLDSAEDSSNSALIYFFGNGRAAVFTENSNRFKVYHTNKAAAEKLEASITEYGSIE